MLTSIQSKVIISVLVCVVLGGVSGAVTVTGIGSWYTTILKPSWNPPNGLFGPVWTTLYVLMGISFALVWHSVHAYKARALTLFVLQFVLNLLWSPLFFYFHQIGWALAEMVVLWLLILVSILLFKSINPIAAWLLVPYLAWVSFATVLTATIYQLN